MPVIQHHTTKNFFLGQGIFALCPGRKYSLVNPSWQPSQKILKSIYIKNCA